MIHIFLNPKFQNLFHHRGRALFSSLWNTEGDRTISLQRTSMVCRVTLPGSLPDEARPPEEKVLPSRGKRAYLKKYWYPTMRDRAKGVFRNTFFGKSRALKEFNNLTRLVSIGSSRVRPIACGEERTFRLLKRAFLLTEEIPGSIALERLLSSGRFSRLDLDSRRRLAAALGCWVRTFHDRGFRDRDLFTRNIVAHVRGEVISFSKIDSSAARGGRKPPGTGGVGLGDIDDLNEDASPHTSRSDRLRFLLAYLGAPEVDQEVRVLAARLAAGRD